MKRPRVSVIVPMYNAAATVAGSLGSLGEQSLSDWEALVVDDGSTDESAEIVRSIAGEDPRVRLIRQENRGVSAARNAATEACRGEFVYWLDPDDLCLPGALDALTNAAEANGFGAAVGHHDVVNPGGEVLHEYRLGPSILGLSELLDGCSTRCGSHVVRRDLLSDSGGRPTRWDESLSLWEDRDYWMRLAEAGVRWGVIDRVVTRYLIRPLDGEGGPSLSKRAHEMASAGGRVLRAVFERHEGEPGFEPDRLDRLLTHNALHSASRAAAISGDGGEAARELNRSTPTAASTDEQLVNAARFGVLYGRGVVPGVSSADPVWLGGLDALWAALGCDATRRARIWNSFARATVTPEALAEACLDALGLGTAREANGLIVVGFGRQGRAAAGEAVRRGIPVRVRDDAEGLTGVPDGVSAEPMDAPVPQGWAVLVSPLSPGSLRARFGGPGVRFAADLLDALVERIGWDPAAMAARSSVDGTGTGRVGHPAPC